jgi:hypothetical protein
MMSMSMDEIAWRKDQRRGRRVAWKTRRQRTWRMQERGTGVFGMSRSEWRVMGDVQ